MTRVTPVFFFLDSGYNPAHYNMALDEFLLGRPSGTFLRVYGWSIPAVSFGYGQSAEKELDLEKLRRDNFHYVRRLTGGRAVLHDAEITYSVAADIGGIFGENLDSAYKAIALALEQTLKILGLSCELEKGSVRDERAKASASLPCFASTSRHELKVNGKKIIGSAQRREKERFLQHGSLILESRLDIAEYLLLDKKGKERYNAILKREATSLREATGESYEYGRLAAAFRKGFGRAWKMKAEEFLPAGEDCDTITALEKKYFSDEWNKSSAK
jgi:lipoyl(octanoyl) transferase